MPYPLVSWDFEFFLVVICFTPFDSERCSELDLAELVAAAELACDDVFVDAFKFTLDCSVDEFTLQDCDSSVVELLVVVEDATTLDFAFKMLVELFETSVVFEESKLDTETEAFLELTVLEEDETELFLTAELEFTDDIAAEEFFTVDELETPLEIAVDALLAETELETVTDDFFTAMLETAVDDFLAENDFDLATDFPVVEELLSVVASATCLDASSTLFSFSTHVVSPEKHVWLRISRIKCTYKFHSMDVNF